MPLLTGDPLRRGVQQPPPRPPVWTDWSGDRSFSRESLGDGRAWQGGASGRGAPASCVWPAGLQTCLTENSLVRFPAWERAVGWEQAWTWMLFLSSVKNH